MRISVNALAIVAIIAAFVAGFASGIVFAYISVVPPPSPVGYVAVIEIDGAIGYRKLGLLAASSTVTPEDVRWAVKQVLLDPSAKAVVLYVNSPGGSAAACEEIYEVVKELASKKPVVAYIAEYGTSGGYMVALPAREIVAAPSSMVGSVGAVMAFINVKGLAEKLGVKTYVFKSGELKDVGNPFRELTPREEQLLSSMVRDVAEKFAEKVRRHRGGKVKDMSEVLTARPYTGSQALSAGLVDSIGTFEDAVARARELGGLPKDAPYRVIRKAPGLLELLLGSSYSMAGHAPPLKPSIEILTMWPLPSGIVVVNNGVIINNAEISEKG